MVYSVNIGAGFQFVILGLFLIPAILFLLSLQNTLKVISQENRRMPPGNVWLLFVPFFNFIWQFIVVDKIAQSIAAECARLHIPVKEDKPTYGIGLAWNICNFSIIIPFFGGLASLITFIIYWVKVSDYKKLIEANQNNFMLDAERNIFHGDKV